jgi:hypothetical protein
MLKITARTNKGKHIIQVPESWQEVTTEKFIRIIKEWDGEDWIKLFSILSDQDYDGISQSKDSKLEGTLYQAIEFVLSNFDFEKLEVPSFLMFNNRQVQIPKNIGRLSIGQSIQARKSLEGLSDIREGISMITAIYLQPLIDKENYDHLRAIEIEQDILKMPIIHIFPIGFFLLRELERSGIKSMDVWLQVKVMLQNVIKRLRKLLMLKG